MLPFLEPKKIVQIIRSRRKADGSRQGPDIEIAPEHKADGGEAGGLEKCAEDLLRAIEGKSVSGIASALKEAFEKLDSEPHEEGPHIEEEE